MAVKRNLKPPVNVPCSQCGRERMAPYYHRKQYAAKKCKNCSATGRVVTHGQCYTRIYNIWTGMRRRGGIIKGSEVHRRHWADKGITVCQEWANSFETFRDWALQNGYTDARSIDRIDENGNYEPSNCQWVSQAVQVRKQKRTKLDAAKAEEIRQMGRAEVPAKEIAGKFGIAVATVYKIINGRKWKHDPECGLVVMGA